MSAGKDMCSLALVHQVCKTFEVHPGSGGESIEFGREPALDANSVTPPTHCWCPCALEHVHPCQDWLNEHFGKRFSCSEYIDLDEIAEELDFDSTLTVL